MKILYVSPGGIDASVNAVYAKGLRQNGVEVIEFAAKEKGVRKYAGLFRLYRSHRKNLDAVFIGVGLPGFVLWMRLISRNRIVYNALCSEYERIIVSRRLAGRFSLKAAYYWLQDFIAGQAASLVMLESEHQISYFHRLFLVPKRKLFLARTGVDEEKFFFKPEIGKFDKFTVIFRGRLLPEAGGEYAVRAAKLLEKEGVRVIMHAFGQELHKVQALIYELKPSNLEMVAEFLPFEKIRVLMQRSHLSLGQLSAHERLVRTIPHKAYESLCLKLPYLTARNPAVMELLREGETCIACNPADPGDLAKKILWAQRHPQDLARIAENGFLMYQKNLTSRVLAGKVLEHIAGPGSR